MSLLPPSKRRSRILVYQDFGEEKVEVHKAFEGDLRDAEAPGDRLEARSFAP